MKKNYLDRILDNKISNMEIVYKENVSINDTLEIDDPKDLFDDISCDLDIINEKLEKNYILTLINRVIEEENKVTREEDETTGTLLLDELEMILNALFGGLIAYNILNDVICSFRIDKKKRLKIMDTILTIKGLN